MSGRTMGNLSIRNHGTSRVLSWHRYVLVVPVLCLGIVLSVVFFYILQEQEQARTQAEFERETNNYVAAIQTGINRNLEVLQSIGGLYAASSKVVRHDFREVVKGPLLRHGEIQALSWNKRVAHSERKQYEDTLRQEGYPEFQFKDLGPDGQKVVAAERPEYIVVTYIEPYEGNEAALGLNVASNTTRLEALDRARDTGEMITTARITLVQETGEQFGILILRPIYKNGAPRETVEQRRQNLTGFAVGVFRVGDMVEASLKDLSKGNINVQLDDETSPAGKRFLYLHQEQLEARDGVYMRAALEIPGRQWSLLFWPTAEFFAAHGTWQAWGVLQGGLGITFLVVAYLLTIINRAAKIEGLAAELSHANKDLENEITERVQAEQQIRASLQEKEALLKEINHRVKNNLQLVSSLLRIQSATIEDEQALQAFRQSQDRVRSIALIHEKLYQSKDMARIDLADYLRSLTSSLFLSYGSSSEAIELKIHAEGVHLGVDTAIPCALIINELVSNSLQHAFPGGMEGEIRIELRSEENQSVQMVSDNGVGFPKDFDLRNTGTLGMELVRTLVDQLEGTIELDRSGGTAIKIMFTEAGSAAETIEPD